MSDTTLDPRDPSSASAGAGGASAQGHPVVLYCDLKVDPAREAAMLDHFHGRFRPTAATFPGFIDLKLLKLRTVMQGDDLAPHVGYRFQLTFESEELRLLWVASDAHQEVWPPMEDALTDKNFHVSLWDDV